jgi:hypothetical protein
MSRKRPRQSDSAFSTLTPDQQRAWLARREGLVLLGSGGLRWIESRDSDSRARRGFCGECGSSLFWDAHERDVISVAAGGLDGPTGLRVLAHVHVSEAGDHYDLPEDGLHRHQRLSST